MADEDDMGIGDDGADAAVATSSGSSSGGFVPMLLKWVAIGLAGILLIVVVVYFTGMILGWNDVATGTTVIENPEEYSVAQEPLDWYTPLDFKVRTVSDDSVQVVAKIYLGYKKDDKTASSDISAQLIPIKDFLRRYFRGRTAEELLPQNEDSIRIEIRNAINDNILTNSKIKDVRFEQFDTIVQ